MLLLFLYLRLHRFFIAVTDVVTNIALTVNLFTATMLLLFLYLRLHCYFLVSIVVTYVVIVIALTVNLFTATMLLLFLYHRLNSYFLVSIVVTDVITVIALTVNLFTATTLLLLFYFPHSYFSINPWFMRYSIVLCSKCSFFSVLSLYSCFSAEYFNKSHAKLSYSDAVNNWVYERVKNDCKNCQHQTTICYI